MDPTNIIAAVMAVSLGDFTNAELAALNNSVQCFGTVSPINIGFQKAKDYMLIDDTGKPTDLDALRKALAFTVNQRVDAGTFV